jgi:hypothetical protein
VAAVTSARVVTHAVVDAAKGINNVQRRSFDRYLDRREFDPRGDIARFTSYWSDQKLAIGFEDQNKERAKRHRSGIPEEVRHQEPPKAPIPGTRPPGRVTYQSGRPPTSGGTGEVSSAQRRGKDILNQGGGEHRAMRRPGN